MEAERARFEAWVSAAPYELFVERFPDDATQTAWPGQYCSGTLQLAWEAWQAALTRDAREGDAS